MGYRHQTEDQTTYRNTALPLRGVTSVHFRSLTKRKGCHSRLWDPSVRLYFYWPKNKT